MIAQLALGKAFKAAQWFWNSPLCSFHREIYGNMAGGVPSQVLFTGKKRKGFTAQAHMVACGGLAALAMGLGVATALTVTLAPLLIPAMIAAEWGGILLGTAMGGIVTFMMTVMAAAGAGVIKGSSNAMNDYFLRYGKELRAACPPEEIAVAQAALLRATGAAQDFKNASAPAVVTGEAVTPMKALKLKHPQSNL